jgi:hypothetical protein
MKLAYSSKKIGGYLLAFFLLFGILTVASSSAQAQYPWGYGRQDRQDRRDRDRDRDRDDRWDRRNDRYRDRNYGNYGYETARQQGSKYWRNATEGYNSYYGNRSQYKEVFRSAFEQGYRDGFQRYGYNNNRRGRWDNRWPRY